MEVRYLNLKSGHRMLEMACDNVAQLANGNPSSLKDVIIRADKAGNTFYYGVLVNIKSNLINMVNDIYLHLLGPVKQMLTMMEDMSDIDLGDVSSAFDFDYEDKLVIQLTDLYGRLSDFGKSESEIFQYIQNNYSVTESTCNEIKKNYEYSKKFGEIGNYLDYPSIEVIESKVGDRYDFSKNYRGDLVGDIKTSNYYRNKGEDKNYTVDKTLLNEKIKAVKEIYGLSDDEAKKLFAIVAREDVPLGSHSSGQIYYEAANVMSSALNRANSDDYFNVDDRDNPISQLFTPSQYKGALYDKYSKFLNNTPDEVVDAVCDVLLSGVPSHDYNSYHGAGYVDGIPNKVHFVEGGNNYFNY